MWRSLKIVKNRKLLIIIILPHRYLHKMELLDLNSEIKFIYSRALLVHALLIRTTHTRRASTLCSGVPILGAHPLAVLWLHTLPSNALLSFGGKSKHRGKQVALIHTMTHRRSYSRQVLTDVHCKKFFAKCLKYQYVSMVYINNNIQY